VERLGFVPRHALMGQRSAGIGRTGMFIAIDAAVDVLQRMLELNHPISADFIVRLVVEMRRQRSGMVQTAVSVVRRRRGRALIVVQVQFAFVRDFLVQWLQHRRGVAMVVDDDDGLPLSDGGTESD
jgi:hypothetical protein